MDTLSWIKTIDYKKHLDEDSSLIVQECGLETYLKLVQVIGNSRIYLSSKPIQSMKREFIKQNKENYSIRELQRMLNVSEDFVKSVIRDNP